MWGVYRSSLKPPKLLRTLNEHLNKYQTCFMQTRSIALVPGFWIPRFWDSKSGRHHLLSRQRCRKKRPKRDKSWGILWHYHHFSADFLYKCTILGYIWYLWYCHYAIACMVKKEELAHRELTLLSRSSAAKCLRHCTQTDRPNAGRGRENTSSAGVRSRAQAEEGTEIRVERGALIWNTDAVQKHKKWRGVGVSNRTKACGPRRTRGKQCGNSKHFAREMDLL